jgi:hypothetical protein
MAQPQMRMINDLTAMVTILSPEQRKAISDPGNASGEERGQAANSKGGQDQAVMACNSGGN